MTIERVLIVSSPTCEKDKTQAGVVYLATVLKDLGLEFDLLDLSGTIDYFDPPEEFFSPCDSEFWRSSRIFSDFTWLDQHLPTTYAEYDAVFYSSLFSPDILIQGRHALNQKHHFPNSLCIVGGSALSCLDDQQLSVVTSIFDFVCTGYDIREMISAILQEKPRLPKSGVGKHIRTNGNVFVQPDYRLVDVRRFVTSYSGHGCEWGKCRFCNSSLNCGIFCRPIPELIDEIEQLAGLNGMVKDVMLSSDSFTEDYLTSLASSLSDRKSKVPYNVMLRGERWVSNGLGDKLRKSGCSDVFIGAEALCDEILSVMNKGLNTSSILNAIKALSSHVQVILGLILFVPGVTEKQLNEQLQNIEKILPHVSAIEPEILTVIQRTEFAKEPGRYGIQLWAKEKAVNDSWCYGLSPDIPWTFTSDRDARTWFRYYEKLRRLTQGFVEPHYWDSIDEVQSRF
ncbi:MAG: radical SAM protein [Syntrophales bacterium]|nr:radical SAM protein [Syntrophales bacterium]